MARLTARMVLWWTSAYQATAGCITLSKQKALASNVCIGEDMKTFSFRSTSY